jgi:hypothetical protein
MTNRDRIREHGLIVQRHLDSILSEFKPGAEIFLIVYRPEDATGETDFTMGSCSLEDARRVIDRRIGDPKGITIPPDAPPLSDVMIGDEPDNPDWGDRECGCPMNRPHYALCHWADYE